MFENKYQRHDYTEFADLIDEIGQVACSNDPDSYFPANKGVFTEDNRRALAMCKECPIIAECLTFALKWNEHLGWHKRLHATYHEER